VREFCATNVPYGTEQDQRFLRIGSSAVSGVGAKRMKIQFKLPRNESAQGRLHSDPMAGHWTVCRPLTRIVSTFQIQIPLHPGPRKERGICCPAVWTTPVPASATEPNELESFQPSMLCTRSLPIYFSDDRAVPPTSYEQMRGLTT
jgi:hypothetical protein